MHKRWQVVPTRHPASSPPDRHRSERSSSFGSLCRRFNLFSLPFQTLRQLRTGLSIQQERHVIKPRGRDSEDNQPGTGRKDRIGEGPEETREGTA